jgi:hypothetical protein
MGTLRRGSRRYSPLARRRSASTSRGSPVAKNVLHSFTMCSPSSTTTVLQNEGASSVDRYDSGQTKPKYCNAPIVPRGGPCGSRARRRYTVGCHGCSVLIPRLRKRFVFEVREGRLATEILADLRRATDFGAVPWNLGIPPNDSLRRFRNQIARHGLLRPVPASATGTTRQRPVAHRRRSPPTVQPRRGPAEARSGPSRRGKQEC